MCFLRYDNGEEHIYPNINDKITDVSKNFSPLSGERKCYIIHVSINNDPEEECIQLRRNVKITAILE